MTVAVRLTDEEEQLVRSYAKLSKRTVSDVLRTAVLERIEDEYDVRLFEEAEREFAKDPTVYTQAEVEQALGLA